MCSSVSDTTNTIMDNIKESANVIEESPSLTSILKINSNDTKEFICGYGSAVINVTVTFPINKIIFRQILEGAPARSALRQISQEGIRLLYRGILPPLCQKTISISLMFSMYEGCRQRLCLLGANPVLANILSAGITGTTEAILMPLERVQTLLQDWRYHNKLKNTTHAFRYLWTKYGVAECYRGMVPIVYRNSSSNLMFFSLRDWFKGIVGDRDTLLVNFVSGALIGGFTSTVFYPMNVIKIHMQSKIGGDFDKFFTVTRDIYISRNRSLTAFYTGVQLNFLRSFISWGVIGASYDFLKKLLF